MAIEVRPYDIAREAEWNAFVHASNEGTIFHRLDFLAYHGDRFQSHEHHLAWYKGSSLFGVMPLSVLPEQDSNVAKSPYGASYGGPVFADALTYAESYNVVTTLLEFLRHASVDACTITLPLRAYYRSYNDTLRLVLLEHGFRCVNRDIVSIVPLGDGRKARQIVNARVRRHFRKAEKAGVRAVHATSINAFEPVLVKTFDKLGIKPTHTIGELSNLVERIPERVYVDVAYVDDQPVAGIGFFVINDRVNSSFYLCQDPGMRDLQGLTFLILLALERAQNEGFLWFDFGTSSAGQKASTNLFEFKEGFGAVGQFRETYAWNADRD